MGNPYFGGDPASREPLKRAQLVDLAKFALDFFSIFFLGGNLTVAYRPTY